MKYFDLLPRRGWFLVLAVTALALIGGGLVIQSAFRIAPCPLCIFQRLLYAIFALVTLAGGAIPRFGRVWAGGALVVAVGGAVTAGYQSWMQLFPHLARECSYTDPNLIERLVDWLGMQWPSLFLATGFCSGRDWEWLGLSIANWSFVAFGGYSVIAAILLLRNGTAKP